MKSNCVVRKKFGNGILGLIFALCLIGPSAWGQTVDCAAAEKARVDTHPYQTFYLTHSSQPNDANEIVVAVRNLLEPSVKIYLVPSQNAIVIRGTAEQLALAQKVINDLDRPKKIYRLTYTITEMDGGKRVGVQHFAIVAAAGQRTLVKQGSKVPVVTASNKEGDLTQTQINYLDVGLTFDVTIDQYANGGRLRSRVEQSNVAEEKSGVGPQDPLLRQTVLEGFSFLIPGKPLVLGSLDIPGSTRRLDVDVMMETIAQ